MCRSNFHVRRCLAAAVLVSVAAPGHTTPVSWTGGSSFWDIVTNWSSNPALPGIADDVTIDVPGAQTITVRATGGPFSIASLTVTGNEVLAITGNTLTVANAFVHAATTTVSGGTLVLNGASNLLTLNQSAGQLSGTGAVLISGPAGLSLAGWSGSATTTLAGATALTGTGVRLDGGRVLRNLGTLTQTNANVDMNSRTLGNAEARNGSVVNAAVATWISNATASASNFIYASNQGAGDTGAGSLFTNQGSFVKQGAAITEVRSSFVNSGAISVQQGTMLITSAFDNGGTLSVAAGAVLQSTNAIFTNSGRLRGNGTVRTLLNGHLLDNGVIAPGTSTGTLTVDGDLIFGPAGRLEIEIAGAADFDKLVVTDSASFAGTLEVLGLGYVPAIGDSFKIVTFNQRLAGSSFAGLSWSGFGSDIVFTATYNLTDVTLNVVAVPEPPRWALLPLGLAVAGFLARRRST
jgi:hypothetical protein